MQIYDTVLRMRALLLARGVVLEPSSADGRESYVGPGDRARDIWEAFCAVIGDGVFDPSVEWGETLAVGVSAGFLFEAGYAEAQPADDGPGFPEHFQLCFTRMFEFASGGLKGLSLLIAYEPASDLRLLKASLFGDSGPAPAADPPAAVKASAKTWMERVESEPAFVVPMNRHRATHCSFWIDDVG